ncbi:hypothetical protein SK128_013042 [Halocaridina rubra]|uniref:TNFR-Cys domain-containing protein n=1 Tax=Halocaridina rubra TaxID=373956 RepID=A0AAN8XCI9_HALRR
MIGRGWWLLVLTVCDVWMVCYVCGGSSCQQGQEFYNTRDGQCVPCTRCHDPLVVVVQCYPFQDAICAPAMNFLPNLPQHPEAQAPITLSNSNTKNAARKTHSREKQNSSLYHRHISKSKKKFNPQEGTNKTYIHNKDLGNSSMHLSVSDFEKIKLGYTRHHHRHKHRGEHSKHRTILSNNDKSLVAVSLDSEVNSNDSISQRYGANESVLGLPGSGFTDVNITDGANSHKDINGDLRETKPSHWTNIFFIMTIVIISVCVIVLIIIIVSHIRSIFIRQKLKRVCEEAQTENSEVTVLEQLLPTVVSNTMSQNNVSSRNTTLNTRCHVSRPSVTATSIPSTPTDSSRRQAVVDSEQITGQMYPPIPFTMDRLLEQRRVLGPSPSVDTNLYIESWQQVDSQLPSQHTPAASPRIDARQMRPCQCASANPSPLPLRTYRRLGHSSASASPVNLVRSLGASRTPLQRGLVGTPSIFQQ